MFVAQRVMKFLEEQGVKHVFGIPGYATGPFYACFMTSSIQHLLTRHEEGAAFAAYGYGMLGTGLAACFATSGGAATHLLPGIASAFANSVPMIAITGQVETRKMGRGAFQDTSGKGVRSPNTLEMFRSVTLHSEEIQNPTELEHALFRLRRALNSPRKGPVHLSIPVDILVQEAPEQHVDDQPLPAVGEFSQEQVQEVLHALRDAKAPLVLFGRGCQGYKATVARFLETTKLPSATTLQGLSCVGFDVPGFLGALGVAGSPQANAWVSQFCDTILIVGSSLGEFTTQGFELFQNQRLRLIHIDVDPLALNRRAEIAIAADGKAFLEALQQGWPHSDLSSHAHALKICQENFPRKATVRRLFDDKPGISPMDLMEDISKIAPTNTVYIADAGNNAAWACHYLDLKEGQEFCIDINMGCMGSGVLAAVGAKCLHPERPVIAICGDGGFMMAGQEVATAADNDLGVIWIVLNDGKLGMIEQAFLQKFGKTLASRFKYGDVSGMAKAMGADAYHIDSRPEFQRILRDILRSPHARPVVLDVCINDFYLPTIYARVERSESDAKIAEALGHSRSLIADFLKTR